MAEDQYAYSKPNARKALARIRTTTGKRRIAFAIGRLATTAPVVMVVRGKPSLARIKLNSAGYAKDAKPSGVNLNTLQKKPIYINHGQLSWDPERHVLVMECARKPSPALAQMFRNFFQKQWQITPFWRLVNFRNLRPDAEQGGDAEEAEDSEALRRAGDEPIDPEIAKLEESEILDEWTDEDAPEVDPNPPPPYTAPDELPPYSETDNPPAYSETAEAVGRPDVPPAVIQANAERLTSYILDKRNTLPWAKDADPDRLKALFEKLLSDVSYERVLLELIRSVNTDAVLQAAAALPKQPLTSDENGIAEVTDALLAMGTNLAEQRGVLGAAEIPDGFRIREMVAKQWAKSGDVPAATLVENLISILGPSIQAANDVKLRGFIGLGPHQAAPNPNAPVRGGSSIDTNAPFLMTLWREAHSTVIKQIDELKLRVDQVLKQRDPAWSVESRGGSWEKVDRVPRALNPTGLTTELRVLAASKGDVRAKRIAVLNAAVDAHIHYVANDEVITDLDDNPFEVDGLMRDTLLKALSEIRQALATAQ